MAKENYHEDSPTLPLQIPTGKNGKIEKRLQSAHRPAVISPF